MTSTSAEDGIVMRVVEGAAAAQALDVDAHPWNS